MNQPPEIIACTNGPLLVRGKVDLTSSTGEPIERSRGTVALCRCGASSIKPFCDGSHKLVGFITEDHPPVPKSELESEQEFEEDDLES